MGGGAPHFFPLNIWVHMCYDPPNPGESEASYEVFT